MCNVNTMLLIDYLFTCSFLWSTLFFLLFFHQE